MKRTILLTFDLEEFDLPLEYGIQIREQEQHAVTNEGLDRLRALLSAYNIAATFFTTGSYAVKNAEALQELSGLHEIASHSLKHTGFNPSDPADSKVLIEKIIRKNVSGFRMPRFAKTGRAKLKADGFKYDSSLNPVYLPGRYNYLQAPRSVFRDSSSELIEIPLSASPILRIPLFWLSFKNLPFTVYAGLCKTTLRKDGYLHLCLHPWEFADLTGYNLPGYIKRISGEDYTRRLEKLIIVLREEAEFLTVSAFLESIHPIEKSFNLDRL